MPIRKKKTLTEDDLRAINTRLPRISEALANTCSGLIQLANEFAAHREWLEPHVFEQLLREAGFGKAPSLCQMLDIVNELRGFQSNR
jgi:hypothetical protein